MNENQLKTDKELDNSIAFICEGLQINAASDDLLDRFSYYFDLYCNYFSLVLNEWYDLRIAVSYAEIYLLQQPSFAQLVVSPNDYMRYIDVLEGIVTIYQRCAQRRMETKKNFYE